MIMTGVVYDGIYYTHTRIFRIVENNGLKSSPILYNLIFGQYRFLRCMAQNLVFELNKKKEGFFWTILAQKKDLKNEQFFPQKNH